MIRASLALALLATGVAASAQDVLIRNATVHTASVAGTLRDTDVLVRAGKIAVIGSGLATPAGVAVVDAGGHEREVTVEELCNLFRRHVFAFTGGDFGRFLDERGHIFLGHFFKQFFCAEGFCQKACAGKDGNKRNDR